MSAPATGKRPIGARWVDISKQDEENPKYRSRSVAKEVRRFPMPELYSATPPLECLRRTVSDVMTGTGRTTPKKLFVCNVPRAYFYASSIRFAYVKVMDED